MAEVALVTDELVVLSGPSSIQVSVDVGAKGDRGSIVYASLGNPNAVLLDQSPNPKDLCINILGTDDEYSYIYQYNATITGSYQWVPLVKLNTPIYNKNLVGTFAAGTKQFDIPIINIVDETTAQLLTSANFSVQFNIQNSKPLASSCTLGSIVLDPSTQTYVLPITVKSVENSSGTWSDLVGTKTVQFSITIVV